MRPQTSALHSLLHKGNACRVIYAKRQQDIRVAMDVKKKTWLGNILYFNPSTLKYKEITLTRKNIHRSIGPKRLLGNVTGQLYKHLVPNMGLRPQHSGPGASVLHSCLTQRPSSRRMEPKQHALVADPQAPAEAAGREPCLGPPDHPPVRQPPHTNMRLQLLLRIINMNHWKNCCQNRCGQDKCERMGKK